MIKTSCAKFRRQNRPNNTLLPTWAAFLSQKHLILHDLYYYNYIYMLISIKILIMKIIMKLNKQMSFLYIIYIYMIMCVGVPLRARTVLEMVHLDGRAGWRTRELRALSEVLLRASFVCKGIP